MALVDRRGVLHGWTHAFADTLAQGDIDLSGRVVADVLPELGNGGWDEIWQAVQEAGVAWCSFAGSDYGADEEHLVEVEVCKFLGHGTDLAKLEVRKGRRADARLQLLQQEILEAMASGVALPQIMDLLCRRAESFAPSVHCSVLTLDSDGRLHHLAGPSLPAHYSQAIDGMQIGPAAGSCGTATFRGEPVEVTDIATDPLWADFKDLALPLGLRACWSSPIKSADGTVLGAFAFYFPTPRPPSFVERQIVAKCVHLCAIALEHEKARKRIYDLVFHDSLTGLPNRQRIQKRIDELLSVVAGTNHRLAIHFVGLDQFQSINDAMGHATGDELLMAVAERLQKVAATGEMIARIGGGEFMLVQVGDLKPKDIAGRARDIIEVIERPYETSGQKLVVGASVGIALGPGDGDNADELMKGAALALRKGKVLRRGTYYFYEKQLNARMQDRCRLEGGLRAGLAAGEFELYFQPIVSLRDGSIVRAEALLRWHHDGEMISPAQFIPVAEDIGLIVPLGAWALEQACAAAVDWPEHVSVAVNLSPAQFEKPGLVQTVMQALEKTGLQASRLSLEITESVLLQENAVNIAILDQLSDLGVRIALDDFGTGYSSLSYLQRFAFDRLKIDRSFIGSITRNSGSLKIVRSIIMLAHSLGLKVTAEGVETGTQLAMVQNEGCDDVQGFYLAPPLPVEAFSELLQGTPWPYDRLGAAS